MVATGGFDMFAVGPVFVVGLAVAFVLWLLACLAIAAVLGAASEPRPRPASKGVRLHAAPMDRSVSIRVRGRCRRGSQGMTADQLSGGRTAAS